MYTVAAKYQEHVRTVEGVASGAPGAEAFDAYPLGGLIHRHGGEEGRRSNRCQEIGQDAVSGGIQSALGAAKRSHRLGSVTFNYGLKTRRDFIQRLVQRDAMERAVGATLKGM